MSEAQQIKEQCLMMAAVELEMLLHIIGDLGYIGYKISLCRIKGYSYGQCARNFRVSKSRAQWHWESCKNKGYDAQLKKIFNIQ